MARQTINTGTTANDGTGDSLRNAGNKINQNFQEIYQFLGESDQVSPYLFLDSDGIHFNGDSVNVFLTKLNVEDPTQTNTITLPDSSGNVVLDTAAQTLFNKTMAATALTEPQIKDNDSSHNYKIIPGSLTGNVNINIPSLVDSDTFVMTKVAQTLENKILDSATVNFPKINQILDTNGATVTKYEAFPNAVNFVSLGNEATGFKPSVYADGADTNVSLALGGKGDGAVVLDTKVALTSNVQTTSGNIDEELPLIIFNSATPLTAYLLDGKNVGELKYFLNNGTGTATVEPTNMAGGTNVAFAQNEAGFWIWSGVNWHLASKQ
tara:strand:+ start:2068 stop:3036 length:969 start_codon:yes stop_codon:yes gene_type:complete